MAEIKSLPPLSYRSTLFGKRRSLLLWITTITIICGALIGLNPKSLFNENSFKLAIEFFKASASPAFDYEKPVNGADTLASRMAIFFKNLLLENIFK